MVIRRLKPAPILAAAVAGLVVGLAAPGSAALFTVLYGISYPIS